MNPSLKESGETSGMSLPPVSEQAPLPSVGEVQPEVAVQAAGPERAPSAATAMPVAAQSAIPLPMAPVAPVSSPPIDTSEASKSSSGGLIKDNDLIDKEWVDKAKRIVERTRNDPHEQSDQLTGVKAEYMKKRYNKTIKISK
jgi:hypothetical protein